MKIVFIIILFCSLSFYGQKKLASGYDVSFFSEEIISFINKENKKVTKKAINFFKNQEYDSCYVYSNNGILISNNLLEKDVLLYMQGISALEKKLFKKSIYSFSQIKIVSRFKELDLRMGYSYYQLSRFDEAIKSYKKYEHSIYKEEGNLKTLYTNLGICYLHKKQLNKATDYFTKTIRNVEKNKDTVSLINLKTNLANTYYEQYLDDDAIRLFKEAYDLAKGFSNVETKKITAINMAVVEKNRKNFEASVKYYAEHDKLKDSLYNRDRIWELTEKDKQIAVAQKQQEIAVQEEKLKRQKTQRNGLIVGIGGLLVFLGGLGFLYKKLQSQNRFITKQKDALNTANKTKDYLFSVVSHDLRSPVNSIRRQLSELKVHIANEDFSAVKATNNKAIAVTESTSHLLNNVLHWSLEQSNQMLFDVQEIALRPTVAHVLHDYKMLVEVNNILIHEALENALVKADKESLKIVLRNILDNAVKYGGEEIIVKTGVLSNEKAFIEIKDNGVGIPPEKLQKINGLTDLDIDKIDRSKGIGLGVILCHTLIKKNNGVLTFASKPNEGTTITIELENVPV